MKTAGNNGEERYPEAPEKLVSVLRRSHTEPVFIPPTLDDAVLRAARHHLGKDKTAKFRRLPLLPWFAAATAMLVAAALVVVRFHPRSSGSGPSVFAREDVNHDGQVDILDAFALSRQLKQGKISDADLDLNGDGVVDERDMQIIAAKAVKLDKGGPS